MWSWNKVKASSHISFFCGGGPFCEVVWRPENTHGELTGLLEWPVNLSPSLEWPVNLCLQSKITDLILSFKSHVFFCLWLVIGTYILRFFPVICWSYLRTQISLILSTGNKFNSRHHSLSFSFLWNHFVDVILQCYLLSLSRYSVIGNPLNFW